jgi:intracellular septation protein
LRGDAERPKHAQGYEHDWSAGRQDPSHFFKIERQPNSQSLYLGLDFAWALYLISLLFTGLIMKLLYDFFPVLIFFIAYKLWGIYPATAALIIASFIQVIYSWLRYKKVDPMHIVAFILVLFFGGITLILHDAMFLKWKVSIVNWLFGAACLFSQWFSKKSIIQRLMEQNIQLPEPVWKRLNSMWAWFFIVMGTLNLYVAYKYSTNTWVDFKVFGMLGLTIVFVIIQTAYLYKHLNVRP